MAFVTNSFEKSTSEVVVSVEQTPEYQPVGVWDCSAKTIHHHMASMNIIIQHVTFFYHYWDCICTEMELLFCCSHHDEWQRFGGNSCPRVPC